MGYQWVYMRIYEGLTYWPSVATREVPGCVLTKLGYSEKFNPKNLCVMLRVNVCILFQVREKSTVKKAKVASNL